MARARRVVAVLAAVAASAAALGGDGAAGPAAPLLGVNLIQYRFASPYCWGNHILLDYHRFGVRDEVVPALHAMRASGLETLRLQLPHSHGTTHWIPSDGGRIPEPYRTNLTSFLADIRAAGFEQVTIQFHPRGPNEPAGWYTSDPGPYDPALFDENWGFIRDVRGLAEASGPPSMHYDIYGEGAPGNWDVRNKPWWADYVVRLYRNYVDAFGNEDVTISSVAKGMWNYGTTADDVERMRNLVSLLRSTGRPLPTWFSVHPSFDGRALDDLRAVDAVLTENGLSQPLVLSEAGYDNAAVAAAIAEFARTSSRPVAEVIEWPLVDDNVAGKPNVVQPRCPVLPFRVDEYAKALRGGAPSTALRASVGSTGKAALVTAYGHPVRALAAGTYTVTVRDTSAKHSFQLAGYPALGRFATRASGVRFRGTVTWTVLLQRGRFTYAAVGARTARTTFVVLAGG